MTSRSAILLRVLAPLGVGGVTYLARGGPLPRGAELLPPSVVAPLRGPLLAAGARVPHLVMDTLPDAAWSFALGSLLVATWSAPGARRLRAAWLAAGGLLAIGWELAQRAHLVPGTFDLADLVASALAYLAALVTFPSLVSTEPSKETSSCVII